MRCKNTTIDTDDADLQSVLLKTIKINLFIAILSMINYKKNSHIKVTVFIFRYVSRITTLNPRYLGTYDKTLMEKLRLLDSLEEVEKVSIYNLIDSLISKKKLKDNLTNLISS